MPAELATVASGPPTKDDGRALGAAPAVMEQSKADSRDCADIGAAGKTLATLTAQAARKGYQVHALASGGYLVCRWNLARELPDLAAVGALLRQMGAS